MEPLSQPVPNGHAHRNNDPIFFTFSTNRWLFGLSYLFIIVVLSTGIYYGAKFSVRAKIRYCKKLKKADQKRAVSFAILQLGIFFVVILLILHL